MTRFQMLDHVPTGPKSVSPPAPLSSPRMRSLIGSRDNYEMRLLPERERERDGPKWISLDSNLIHLVFAPHLRHPQWIKALWSWQKTDWDIRFTNFVGRKNKGSALLRALSRETACTNCGHPRWERNPRYGEKEILRKKHGSGSHSQGSISSNKKKKW